MHPRQGPQTDLGNFGENRTNPSQGWSGKNNEIREGFFLKTNGGHLRVKSERLKKLVLQAEINGVTCLVCKAGSACYCSVAMNA